MEAKIDIRKLQLLSDRIQQTIDALQQVRSSASGLSHSTPPAYAPQYPQAAMQPGLGYGMAYSAPLPTQQVAPWGTALSHTAPTQGPMAVPGQPQPVFAQVPALMGLVGGIAHTSPAAMVDQRNAEMRASDPARIAQTFPYLFTQFATVPVL